MLCPQRLSQRACAMSSDEEYTNSEEENDEIAELPEIDEEERAKIAARGGKRRFSVSSESASSVKYAAPLLPMRLSQPAPGTLLRVVEGCTCCAKPQWLPVGRRHWSAPLEARLRT